MKKDGRSKPRKLPEEKMEPAITFRGQKGFIRAAVPLHVSLKNLSDHIEKVIGVKPNRRSLVDAAIAAGCAAITARPSLAIDFVEDAAAE